MLDNKNSNARHFWPHVIIILIMLLMPIVAVIMNVRDKTALTNDTLMIYRDNTVHIFFGLIGFMIFSYQIMLLILSIFHRFFDNIREQTLKGSVIFFYCISIPLVCIYLNSVFQGKPIVIVNDNGIKVESLELISWDEINSVEYQQEISRGSGKRRRIIQHAAIIIYFKNNIRWPLDYHSKHYDLSNHSISLNINSFDNSIYKLLYFINRYHKTKK